MVCIVAVQCRINASKNDSNSCNSYHVWFFFPIQSVLSCDALRYAKNYAILSTSYKLGNCLFTLYFSNVLVFFITFQWEIRLLWHFLASFWLYMKIKIILLSFLIFNRETMNNVYHSAEEKEFQEILTCNFAFHFLCEICHTVNKPGFLPSPLIQFLENIASDL